jgi:hypothetical protein
MKAPQARQRVPYSVGQRVPYAVGAMETNTWYKSDDPRAPDFELVPMTQVWWWLPSAIDDGTHVAIRPGGLYLVKERGSPVGSPLQVVPGQAAPVVGVPFWMRNNHYRLGLWEATATA